MAEFSDDPGRSRFELRDGGELVGWLDYRPAGDSVILAHTEVPEAHGGKGYGGALVEGALLALDAQDKTAIATCPFAAAHIERHPELDRYLAPWARRR